MSLNIDEFEDIHQHASSVREWQQIYSQLTAGPLRSSLCQIRNARFHAFRERINQRVVQHGEAPASLIAKHSIDDLLAPLPVAEERDDMGIPRLPGVR